MTRAAVIGLGDISGIHLAAIAKNPEITLAAVCDIDESKREGAPAGVPFYTDYQEILDTYGNEMNAELGYEKLSEKVQSFLNDNSVEQ